MHLVPMYYTLHLYCEMHTAQCAYLFIAHNILVNRIISALRNIDT